MNPALTVAVLACAFLAAESARILAIFPFQAKSHYDVYEPLLKMLSRNGHEVVSVTHFPRHRNRGIEKGDPVDPQNFTDVDISSSLPNLVGSLSLEMFEGFSRWENLKYLTRYGGVGICEPVLNHPEVKKIIESKEKFDVYIVEIFATECFLGIGHVLKIPLIVGAISSVALPWSNEILRNPENPSFIPNWFSGYTDRMTLFERTINTLGLAVTKLAYRIFSDGPSYEIARKHFGDDLPDLDTLRSRVSLILTNGHPAVSTPRPLVPGVKEIGGIHIPITGPPPLQKDLQEYLDSHDRNGIIYFSLGSQIDSSTMPSQVFAALYEAFEQVPQQILWKCPGGKMPALPKNVKCIEWAPQLSVLCHRNARLFITHGGLLGTQEAVYCGVPILGMPLFGDQYLNMAYFVKKGLALEVDFRRLSYERISNTLNELLGNKSYTEMARRASLEFKDRPMPPVKEATYWVEYLIRHGPDSFKSAALEMAWYQYLLLDVIVILAAIICFSIWAMWKLFKLIFCRRTATIDVNKKRK